MLLFLLYLLGSATCLHAQRLNNQWRIGFNQGIDFNSPTPTVVTNSAINTPEGSASVADPTTGQLLFYTDGATVWNRNNAVMQNGTGLLGGSPPLLTSTTAAMICPRPGNSQQYYIFTIDRQGSPNGLRYSLVDMSLQGGLGAIVAGQKNILLFNTGSEKLQIVPHANGASLWVLTHSLPNTFAAFLVDASGVSTVPVLSTLGNEHVQVKGHMKINRQFNLIAMGNFFNSEVELFDFNRSTGQLSNFRSFGVNFVFPFLYGIEFSHSGSRLYVANQLYVLQFDLLAGSLAAIEASGVIVGGNGLTQPGTLQLGPDGRIYVANQNIDRIDCPEALGTACNYVSNPLPNLSMGDAGLPNWVYSAGDLPFLNLPNAILFKDSCFANVASLQLLDTTKINQVRWKMGDPASASNQQTGFQVNHNFSSTGTYNITALLDKNCGNPDTLRLTVTIVNCAQNSINVIGDTCNLLQALQFRLNDNSSAASFFWNFGDPSSGTNDTLTTLTSSTLASHVFSRPGTYTVCVRYTEAGGLAREICRTISVGNCCLYALDDFRICLNDTRGIQLRSGTADSVRWLLGDNDLTLPGNSAFVPQISEPGRYPLRAIAYKFSCDTDTLDAFVNVIDCDLGRCSLLAPTAFTPQGDGLNDTFRPILSCSTVFYELRVYNRWGEEVFRTSDSNAGWNGQAKGQDAEQGVYQFVLFYRLEVGETRVGSGSIRLLR